MKRKCPNCGGELVRRPIRPAEKLAKFPASTERKVKGGRLRVFASERASAKDCFRAFAECAA